MRKTEVLGTAMTLDVMVVGAGQAALAPGYFLQRVGVSFCLFDRAHRVGDSWRHRYDSLVLFSTRAYSALPVLTAELAPVTGPVPFIAPQLAPALEAWRAAVPIPPGHVSKHLLLSVLLV